MDLLDSRSFHDTSLSDDVLPWLWYLSWLDVFYCTFILSHSDGTLFVTLHSFNPS